MESPAHDFVQIVAVLVLRRLETLTRTGQDTELAGAPPETARAVLARHDGSLLRALAQSVRRAWLMLEIALAGETLWPQAQRLARGRVGEYARQSAGLLDELVEAGLDDPDLRARCRRCLQALRQADIVAQQRADDHDVLPQGAAVDGAGARRWLPESETQALTALAEDFEEAGEPDLARLVALPAGKGDALVVDLAETFFRRALATQAELQRVMKFEGDVTQLSAAGSAAELAGLIEEQAEYLEALLDGPMDEAEVDDGQVEARFEQGLNCYQNADYEQAIAHFTQALRLVPQNALLYTQRGDCYRLLCDYKRAAADFSQALRLNPRDTGALVSRAEVHRLAGDTEQALADCTAALDIDREHAEAYAGRGDAHAVLGNLDDAIADYTQALDRLPEDFRLFHNRGRAQLQKAEYAWAIADFGRALELNPNHVLSYLHRGEAYRCKGLYTQAILDYTEVLRLHPRNALALGYRGLAHELKGDTDRAIDDYTRALLLEPGNARILCSRGILQRLEGNLDASLADLTEGIRLQPGNWSARYHRGRIFLARGVLNEAIADFTEAIYLNPKLVVGYLSRALAYERLGQVSDAIANCGRALKLDPRSAAAYLVRGVIVSHTGDYGKAVADLTEAIRLDPLVMLAYQERGMAYTLQGKPDEALADYHKLLEHDPRNALAYASRGVVYQMTGQSELALTDFARVLQLDPKSMLAGFNQNLAGAAREQATQLLADYIEGLRPKPPLAGPQLPPIEVALNRPQVKQAVPPRQPDESTPELPALGDDAATKTTADRPAAKPQVKKAQPAATKQVPNRKGATARPAAGEKADKPAPAKKRLPGPKETAIMPAAALTEEMPASPESTEDMLAVSETVTETPEADADALIDELLLVSDDSSPAAVPEPIAAPRAPASPPATARVYCPMCRQTGMPSEVLPDGRARCGSCGVTFVPAPPKTAPVAAPVQTKAAKPTKPAKNKDADDDEERPKFYQEPKLQIAAGVTALVMTLYLLWPASGPSYDPTNPPAPKVGGEARLVSLFYKEMTKTKTAASKYNEQYVKVKGKVAEVEAAKNSVLLEGDSPREKLLVLCRNENEMQKAEKGKTIVAVGYCQGLVKGAIQLSQGHVLGDGDGEK